MKTRKQWYAEVERELDYLRSQRIHWYALAAKEATLARWAPWHNLGANLAIAGALAWAYSMGTCSMPIGCEL